MLFERCADRGFDPSSGKDRMLVVDPISLPHLAKAVRTEMDRLKSLAEDVGDDWPADFDANDIPLYEDIARYISDAQAAASTTLNVGAGKHQWFLTMILPKYAEAHANVLTHIEWEALERVCSKALGRPFPKISRIYQASACTAPLIRALFCAELLCSVHVALISIVSSFARGNVMRTRYLIPLFFVTLATPCRANDADIANIGDGITSYRLSAELCHWPIPSDINAVLNSDEVHFKMKNLRAFALGAKEATERFNLLSKSQIDYCREIKDSRGSMTEDLKGRAK